MKKAVRFNCSSEKINTFFEYKSIPKYKKKIFFDRPAITFFDTVTTYTYEKKENGKNSVNRRTYHKRNINKK
jgi:hypothetical protein